jgi:hypothetical protein
MKKAVFALVLVLCAFALPALAASPEASCPVMPAASVSSIAGAPAPVPMGPIGPPPAPLPYCWDLDRTSCSPVGSTKSCTDGIWSDYVCVCRYDSYYRRNYWDCPEVR